MGAPTIEAITTQLLTLISDDVRDDLIDDTATAIELHFDPIGLRPLRHRDLILGEQCSTDGYYDPFIDPVRPWIFYAADGAPTRVRFTLLHELAHHLFFTAAAHLLDALDQLGGSPERAVRAEEVACHRFASELLIPARDVADVLPTGTTVRPAHVQRLHERLEIASWDAVAVRVAARLISPGAIVILRDGPTVSFCAARGLEGPWWQRGAPVDPAGALARSLRVPQTAQPDVYRWGLADARQLHTDTLPINERLAVAVMSAVPSDGRVNLLEEVEPAWKTREYWCEHCNEERTDGWCEKCHGPRCPVCGRCGCDTIVLNPICAECGLRSPFRPGARMCRSCESDFGLA